MCKCRRRGSEAKLCYSSLLLLFHCRSESNTISWIFSARCCCSAQRGHETALKFDYDYNQHVRWLNIWKSGTFYCCETQRTPGHHCECQSQPEKAFFYRFKLSRTIVRTSPRSWTIKCILMMGYIMGCACFKGKLHEDYEFMMKVRSVGTSWYRWSASI